MPQSKVNKDPRYTYNHDRWIVSLIATGDKFGGHAKIVVEGLQNDPQWRSHSENPQAQDTYIGEYHIIPDTNPTMLNICGIKIPPALVNTQCKFAIYFTERPEYKEGKEDQYASATSTSWRVSKMRALAMIQAIMQERSSHDLLRNFQDYQYAGKYRWFGGNNGHNCITWCQEKLEYAEIEIPDTTWKFLGMIKTSPVKGAHGTLNKTLVNTKEDLEDTENQNKASYSTCSLL